MSGQGNLMTQGIQVTQSHQACGHNSGYDPEARGFESLADSSLV